MKGLSSSGFTKHIQVYVDNVLCATLTDKNAVASTIPIQRVQCTTPLTGTVITFRYTSTIVPQEYWWIVAIFGDPLPCNSSGNSMIPPSIPAQTVDQTSTTSYIDAFKDYASGTTNPPRCGARTCMSDHPNVSWDNNNQKFQIKTLGSADIEGTYKV